MIKTSPFWGSITLIVGCCIGAGMLALPLTTAPYGFLASIIPLAFGWIFMLLSGLALLEVYEHSNHTTNLMGLLEKTLGPAFRYIGFLLFAFLFYSLLTAYLNASSLIFSEWLFQSKGKSSLFVVVSSILLFMTVYMGTKKVDIINRIFVVGIALSYIAFLAVGIFKVNWTNLGIVTPSYQMIFSVPIFIVSFGYQNLIPTIYEYVGKKASITKRAILWGTFATFLVYLLWDGMILGLMGGESHDFSLVKLFGYKTSYISALINSFSLCAIITSLITVALSFCHFITDKPKFKGSPIPALFVVLFPPTVFALFDPSIFLKALQLAGGIGAVSLFGILPSLMLYKMRYTKVLSKGKKYFPLGKGFLLFYLAISAAIVASEIWALF